MRPGPLSSKIVGRVSGPARISINALAASSVLASSKGVQSNLFRAMPSKPQKYHNEARDIKDFV